MEPLSRSPSQTLPCTHVYHIECVGRLRSFGISQACPMCRAELPPGPEKLHEDAVRRFMVLQNRYGQGDDKQWRKITSKKDRRGSDEVTRMVQDAADLGHATAQCCLGVMYRNGQGATKNASTAAKWFRMAAEQGPASVQCNFGIMYMTGQGVAKDGSLCRMPNAIAGKMRLRLRAKRAG